MNELCITTRLSSSDLAAWVQAIGSIVAIVVSAFVVWWQVRKQHRLDVSESHRRNLVDELQSIEAFTDVASVGAARLLIAANSLATEESADHYQITLRNHAGIDLIEQALASADVSVMSNARLSLALLSVRKQVRRLVEVLDGAMAHRGLGVDSHLAAIRTEMSSELLILTQDNNVLIARAAAIRDDLGMPPRSDQDDAVWTRESMSDARLGIVEYDSQTTDEVNTGENRS